MNRIDYVQSSIHFDFALFVCLFYALLQSPDGDSFIAVFEMRNELCEKDGQKYEYARMMDAIRFRT